MQICIESMTILDLHWKRSQSFLFFKRAKQDTLCGYQAFYSRRFYRDEDDLAPDDKYYIRGKKNALWFWQHFGKTITLAAFWYTNSFNWKSNFVLIYYKSEDGYPNFLFSYLLLIASYTYSTYIIWLKKYSVVFYFLNFKHMVTFCSSCHHLQ